MLDSVLQRGQGKYPKNCFFTLPKHVMCMGWKQLVKTNERPSTLLKVSKMLEQLRLAKKQSPGLSSLQMMQMDSLCSSSFFYYSRILSNADCIFFIFQSLAFFFCSNLSLEVYFRDSFSLIYFFIVSFSLRNSNCYCFDNSINLSKKLSRLGGTYFCIRILRVLIVCRKSRNTFLISLFYIFTCSTSRSIKKLPSFSMNQLLNRNFKVWIFSCVSLRFTVRSSSRFSFSYWAKIPPNFLRVGQR